MPNNTKPNPTIFIVDDDPFIQESLEDILTFEGYNCVRASDGKSAIERLTNTQFDLMLLDLRLPRIDGMEVLKKSIEIRPNLPVVMISGQGTIQLAVEATKIGAYDFIEKPLEAERVLITIRNALEKSHLKVQRDHLLTEAKNLYKMIGTDPKMKEIYALIDRTAQVDSKVLITGESGTGKEMVARAIHYNSKRSTFPFIPANCSAIPESLIESELFGHVKGAFTGAVSDRRGKFEQAHQGTLFLDEIGDMSLMMQAKILRVLEDGYVEPVGGHTKKQVDVRIIAASHKDLHHEIENGNFREDLFFRLNVMSIHLPPLRERKADIQPTAEAFLQEICEQNGFPQKTFARNVWPILMGHQWTGNVRELRNVVERAAILSGESLIDAPVVLEALSEKPDTPPQSKSEQSLRQARAKFEKDYILEVLASHDGKIQETATALGIQRSHLWKKMKEYGIK